MIMEESLWKVRLLQLIFTVSLSGLGVIVEGGNATIEFCSNGNFVNVSTTAGSDAEFFSLGVKTLHL